MVNRTGTIVFFDTTFANVYESLAQLNKSFRCLVNLGL